MLPSRYLGREIKLEHPTSLGDLAKFIERGARLPSKILKSISTEEYTGIGYLKLSDISNGRINTNLLQISELDPKYENQCIKTNDLIISKFGPSFKIAIAEIPDDQKVLASDNGYIVRLDENQVDPYFVAAFLSSEDGKEIIARKMVGSSLLNLTKKILKISRFHYFHLISNK